MIFRFITLTTPLLCLIACSNEGQSSEDLIPEEVPEEESTEPFAIDLRLQLKADDVDVVGVTVARDTGERYLLDATRGIYAIEADGAARLVLAREDFPQADIAPVSAFTDMTSLGNERFALTARNDGFLLDLRAGTMQRHFCYLPDDLGEQEVHQLTNSVTYDHGSQLIFAQPQTISNLDDSVLASSIGRFASESGEDLDWFDLSEVDYIAGAMASLTSGELLLGHGSELDRFTLSTSRLDGVVDLEVHGVENIAGLAIDLASNTLLVVDGARDELLELPLGILD